MTSHLFNKGQGTAWGEGRSRGEQQLHPEKYFLQASPKLGIRCYSMGRKEFKTTVPFRIQPRVPSGPPLPRLSIALHCSSS